LFDFVRSGVDLMIVIGYKFGGFVGVGVLVVVCGVVIMLLLYGGG